MTVLRLTPKHELWNDCVAHLERVRMAHFIIDHGGQPKPGLHFLGAVDQNRIVGHISLIKQDIIVPATAWSGNEEIPITDADGNTLTEMLVETFAVDEMHRRQGHGRALQMAALDFTREMGCFQLRSWSTADKPANYALKLSLGFSVHPSTFEASNGTIVCGAYFVKTV